MAAFRHGARLVAARCPMKCAARAVGVVLSVMDRFARLRSRWSWGRPHAWRVVATALGMLVVAAAAAVLLAWGFHLAVAAVVIGILGSLPVLTLTVQALVSGDGHGGRLARGRPARLWDPVRLAPSG